MLLSIITMTFDPAKVYRASSPDRPMGTCSPNCSAGCLVSKWAAWCCQYSAISRLLMPILLFSWPASSVLALETRSNEVGTEFVWKNHRHFHSSGGFLVRRRGVSNWHFNTRVPLSTIQGQTHASKLQRVAPAFCRGPVPHSAGTSRTSQGGSFSRSSPSRRHGSPAVAKKRA